MTEGEFLRLGLGLTAAAGIYAFVRRSRVWAARSPIWSVWLEARVHYALLGLVLSFTTPITVRQGLAESADLAGVFLAGIGGLAVGCSFDLRLLKRWTKAQVWLEIAYGAMLTLFVWLLVQVFFHLAGSNWADLRRTPVQWTLCGLAISSWMRMRGGDASKNFMRGGDASKNKVVEWVPSLGAISGIILAGLGLMQIRAGSFVVRQPFAFHQVIVVEGMAAGMLWCVVLGALVGLVVDLATREIRRGYLYFLMAAGLLLGGGMALNLGLEPLWVGVVAGWWLINATVRRLDVLRALERGLGLVRTVLPVTVGWSIGILVVGGGGLDWTFAGLILTILLLGVPVVRIGAWHGAGRVFDRAALRRTSIKPRHLLEVDDLALVIALGLSAVLPSNQGAALLAAVLVGQRFMHLVALWVARRASAA